MGKTHILGETTKGYWWAKYQRVFWYFVGKTTKGYSPTKLIREMEHLCEGI